MRFLFYILFFSLLSSIYAFISLDLISVPGSIIHFDENFGGWAATKSLVDKIMKEETGTEKYQEAFEEGVTYVYNHSLFYAGILAAKMPSDLITYYYLLFGKPETTPASTIVGEPKISQSSGFKGVDILLQKCGIGSPDDVNFLHLGNCISHLTLQGRRETITYLIQILGVWKAMKETGELTVEQLQEWNQALLSGLQKVHNDI